MITIGPNAWTGFQGLYYSETVINYMINNRVYDSQSLEREEYPTQEVLNTWSLVPSFQVDPQGSRILWLESENKYMLYQKQNGRYVELIPRQLGSFSNCLAFIVRIPLPNGYEVDGYFQEMELEEISDSLELRVSSNYNTYDELLDILNRESITIAPNLWPGFQGLYFGRREFVIYSINNLLYTCDLVRDTTNTLEGFELVLPFEVNLNGSAILMLLSTDDYMLYQERDGIFVELVPRFHESFVLNEVFVLSIPKPYSVEEDEIFPAMPLRVIENTILNRFREGLDELSDEIVNYDQILNLLNPGQVTNPEQINVKLFDNRLSYEALVSRLYNLPIKIPEYLNGKRLNFISFSQISNIQIQRYIIDPLLQPWSDNGNLILTLFDNNGVEYLVKTRYDPVSNKIFPPI